MTTKASPKRPEPTASKSKRASKTGADRVPGQHIMSVHIPIALLKKLDAKAAANKKSGRPGKSRSALSVLAISKIV